LSTATTRKIQTPLARKMAVLGGRTVAEALAQAERGVESHRAAGMSTLTATLVRLEQATTARAPGAESTIYPLASELLDMAGFFDTGPLYKAAFSLCDIADKMHANDVWDWPSIDVHVRAMRLILTEDCKDSTTAKTVLQGLAAVAQRFARAPLDKMDQ